MVVQAGESKAAAIAIVFASLIGPSDVLSIAIGDRFADVRIAAVSAILAFHGLCRGMGGEDGRDAFHLGTETHMEVPFVIAGEGLEASGGWMFGELFKFCNPVRVDGPVGFEIAAHPVKHAFAGRADGDLHSIVQAGQADATLHDFIKLLYVFVHQVAVTARAEEDNGIRIFECGLRLFGPDDVVFPRDLVFAIRGGEPLADELAASAILVLAVSVRAEVGDEDDFLRSCHERGGHGEAEKGEGTREGFHRNRVSDVEMLGELTPGGEPLLRKL